MRINRTRKGFEPSRLKDYWFSRHPLHSSDDVIYCVNPGESEMPNLKTPNRFIKFLYFIGLGPLVGRIVLLLTTTGRKTGLLRVTPLQYEEVDGVYYIGSTRGKKADWFRNLVADPNVEVRVKSRRFKGVAEPITDTASIADFIELRLRRHPRMIGLILKAEGLPPRPERAQLESYAKRMAIVRIRPTE